MRLFIVCIVLLLSSMAIANEQKVVVERRGNYWHITGEVKLAEKSVLALRLLFKGHEIRGSRRRVWVQQQKFSYHYGSLPEKIASGNYVLEMTYFLPSAEGKRRRIVDQREFPIGFAHQERAEVREELLLLQRIIAELREYVPFLVRKSNEFLSGQPAAEKRDVHRWIAIQAERLQKIRQQLDSRRHPKGFAHFPTSIGELRHVLDAADLIYGVQVQRLSKRYQTRFSTDSRQLPAIDTDKYLQDIERRCLAVLEREPFPANLGVVHLESELLWFRDVLSQFDKWCSEAEQNNYHHSRWQQMHEHLSTEFADFSRRADDYALSALPDSAKLVAALKQLSEQGQRLLWRYTADLYRSKGLDEPGDTKKIEVSQQEVRHNIAEGLSRIEKYISRERRREQQQRQKFYKRAQQLFANLLRLDEQTRRLLEEQAELPAEWPAQLAALQKDIQPLGELFPQIYQDFALALYWLRIITDQQQKTNATKLRHRIHLRVFVEKLRSRLAKKQ